MWSPPNNLGGNQCMRVLNAASVVLKGLRNDSKGMVLSPVVPNAEKH